MAGFKCPFCNSVMSLSNDTVMARYPGFNDDNERQYYHGDGWRFGDSCIQIKIYKCPNCVKYTVFAKGLGDAVSDINMRIRPKSFAIQFPEYIPEAIRNDYEEACAIVNLSPKASATLSRRCLQGMIRDFWEIKESNLANAINKLEGKVPAVQWKVIDGVRKIGNIGAHMEKDINLIIDIEPDEAEKLLRLIEHLLEQWYVNRHEQEQLYNDIIGIDETMQEKRKQVT